MADLPTDSPDIPTPMEEASSSSNPRTTIPPKPQTNSILIVKQPLGKEEHRHCRFKATAGAKATELHQQHRNRAAGIIRCVLMLVHGSQCRDRTCVVPRCNTLKKVTSHARSCQKMAACEICRRVIVLSYCHSKECQNPNCPVVFCLKIKKKLIKVVTKQK